ncbi:MAG: replication-associated recombination protein A [Christensenellales bacterium]|jgi:putative ATPase
MDLFEQATRAMAPLPERMRPESLDEFVGQEHIVGQGRLLRRAIEADRLGSCIFFGPPGSGKTTLASIVAATTKSAFEKLNAVTSGVADVRKVVEEARSRQKLYGQSTYLLLDECHRWSKAQSDALLPAIEQGTILFIGSTTENPVIAMTPAIVSRCRIFEFTALLPGHVKTVVKRALTDRKKGLGELNIQMDEQVIDALCHRSNGDVRQALTALELAALSTPMNEQGEIVLDLEAVEQSMQQRILPMDESLRYDMLSAFCKSLRGSDPTAALAWAARLLEAGLDPRIIARRVIAHASEDVGLAEPMAMVQAVAAAQALQLVGMPEARLSLAQAIIYVCQAPKSNAVVTAIDRAQKDAKETWHEKVPDHLRDANYPVPDGEGGLRRPGEGYVYPHEYPGHHYDQPYRPVGLEESEYYHPSDQGFEVEVGKRMAGRKWSRHDKKG